MTGGFSQWYERNCFDPMMDLCETQRNKSIRSEILKDLKATDRILEVGAGSGLNIPHYPAAVSRVTTAGLSTVVSPRAVDKAKKRNLALEYHAGDGRSLPFADACFDAVVSTLILCSVADRREFLSEVWRVLKPGGTFATFEHAYVPPEEGGSAVGSALAWVLYPLHKTAALGCDVLRPFPRDLLKDLGFQTVWQKEVWAPVGAAKFVYGVLSK